MTFKRARSEEQKNIRINQIVGATQALYEKVPYDAITLAKITERLDFSRANLYKYFNTKEEIFLVIVQRDHAAWTEDVLAALATYQTISLPEFSQLWATTLDRQPRLVRLLSILDTVIERNVSVETLAVFKKAMYVDFSRMSDRILELIPNMTQEQSYLFFNFQQRFAIGLYAATVNNDVQKHAIELSGIPYVPEDFVASFARFLKIVLQGLIENNG